MTTFKIERRHQYEVNTDPQRRCYNGCHFSSEMYWGPWESVDINLSSEKADDLLKSWVELNDFAVSQRGPSAKTEFRIVEEKP